MIVKISCIDSLAEALQVARLGADIIEIIIETEEGVDLRSKSKKQTALILNGLKNVVKTSLLIDKKRFKEIDRLLSGMEFDYLFPIHALSDSVMEQVKIGFPDVKLVPTIHVLTESVIQEAIILDGNPNVDYIHLDSRTKDKKGATGKTHNWAISKKIVQNVHKKVILAGGLSPSNVAESIRVVRPYGVDVYSGVLDENRRLDFKKVREFISIAKNT